EHDNQSYVPPGEIDRWERENDPITRFLHVLRERLHATEEEIAAIDRRVQDEIDIATDAADASPMPEPTDALVGIYAHPPAEQPLWFREGVRSAVEKHERPSSWGTHDG
ncbi:MAG TPA: thiamine pyrophosphate-dependent enzyme, partial [Gemmatimonadales bacterium]